MLPIGSDIPKGPPTRKRKKLKKKKIQAELISIAVDSQEGENTSSWRLKGKKKTKIKTPPGFWKY